ncbi:MAG: uroporphyrinogen decarboxylase family protein [Lachnospiraceae bacterium]|nr:uroporphyrinogen decarboxylase family protein [Lachnospiraceae bacterium]
MGNIKDFKCTYDHSAGISPEITEGLSLTFPDAYQHADTMAVLSKRLKEAEGMDFCELPFCHTVEAEAMGGNINFGNEKAGPRAGVYVCETVEELNGLSRIDFSAGRIREVLTACEILKKQGETVVLMISGPFTILNVLIDPRHVFRAMRRNPEKLQPFFDRLQEELLQFAAKAVKSGADVLSYADSSGSLNIIGPKNMEYITERFTVPFLKKAVQITDGKAQIALCPKTSFALTGTGAAEWKNLAVQKDSSYLNACLQVKKQAALTGQMCIKNRAYKVSEQIKVLEFT